jgi:hypothetical protein
VTRHLEAQVDAARAVAQEAAVDRQSRAAREDVCRLLGVTFRVVGERLWLGGYMLGTDRRDGQSPFGFGTDAVVGLAVVVQIAGELISGAVALLAQDNLYGAAALLRQLVEVEYLAWAFAEDEQEAMSWMRSDRDERRHMWQPKHLRDRSQDHFRATDYHSHCERGGHPTPDATMLLPGHSRRQLPELWWLDLAEHGVSTWRYANDAAHRLGYEDWMRSRSEENDLPNAIERWEQRDRLRSVARQMQTLLIPGQ